jgi:hypothetical protein
VYKSLRDLDIAIQYNTQPHIYNESRQNNQIRSSLSWHDAELAEFDMKLHRKQARNRTKKIQMAFKVVCNLRRLAGSKKSATSESSDNKVLSIKEEGRASMSDFTDSDARIGWTMGQFNDDLDPIKENGGNNDEEYETNDNGDYMSDIVEGDMEEPKTNRNNGPTDGFSVSFSEEIEKNTGEKQTSRIASRAVFKYALKSNMSETSKSSVEGKGNSKVEIKPVNQTEYIDSFAQQDESVTVKSSPSPQILRPQSAPFKMLQKYSSINTLNSMRTTPTHRATTPHAKQQISSAPPSGNQNRQTATKSKHYRIQASVMIHNRTCSPPERHAIHSCNAASVINGPYTSTESLLSPQVPRQITQRYHHTSAWYHVPGRYPTTEQDCPPKRNQKRVDSAQKKLIRNLQSRSGNKLLSSKFPTYLGSNSSNF